MIMSHAELSREYHLPPPDALHANQGLEQGLTISEGTQEDDVLSEETCANYRARLDVIREQISTASNGETLTELREEEKWIASELDKGLNIHGKRRKFADEGSRCRTAVDNAIERALRHLAKFAPELAQHLRENIKAPGGYRYTGGETWEGEVYPTSR